MIILGTWTLRVPLGFSVKGLGLRGFGVYGFRDLGSRVQGLGWADF